MSSEWQEVRNYETPYAEWRLAVSEIATAAYNDPFGQDPTSKLGEDHWREMYSQGKTPHEALERQTAETHD